MNTGQICISSDWTGGATQRFLVVDETLSGKYVLRHMPVEMTRMDGSKYLAEPLIGLILRDKSEVYFLG